MRQSLTVRKQSHPWRVLPLVVVFCLAVSGIGARLAITTATLGNEPASEEVGSASEGRPVSPRRMLLPKFRHAAVATVPRFVGAVAYVFRQPPPLLVKVCLIGAGIKLLC
jgi:hypothetical protein